MNKIENPYELRLTAGLPPGTDSYEQLSINPQLPRPPPKLTRPLPDWPPLEQRKGKWIAKYLNQLDPESEFDHVIRTSNFFGVSPFGASLAYTAIICINSQTPAGAAAVHGGTITTIPHGRFYRTELQILDWLVHGSTAPETAESISHINKIHQGVWKRKPGTFSSTWEGKMTIIGISYFDTWTTSEQKIVGAESAECFIQQFCELWFPRCLQFLGRDVLLTFIPPQCRRRQNIGEPNWLRSKIIKFVFKCYLDISDTFLSDPAEPTMLYFREKLQRLDMSHIDKDLRTRRNWQNNLMWWFTILLGFILFHWVCLKLG
ncbi:unnamed protein product [Clonostachys rosea]|uniref:ER-bound oxygenase mpaB/mpaB'/Rubber oxygenase catalytic domain-containing protein n=1 Tax=Bionectria ochroleuca TaxID=29856 RepID=A0ABY6V1W8_BIOOC|nr:unnamed protein product [Clonostachys rosea]